MSDNQVVDEFAEAGIAELQTFLTQAAQTVESTFAKYRGDDGQVRYQDLSGEDGTIIRETNQKMGQARARFEQLVQHQAIHETAANLSKALGRPVQAIPSQPHGGQARHISLGSHVWKALQERPYSGAGEWSVGAGDWKDVGDPDGRVSRKAARGSVESKAILGEDDALAGVDTEYAPETVRVGVIVETLYQPHNIAPMIPQVPTTQTAIPYMVETVNAEAAAETAEGATTAEASISWAETSDPVRKITVGMPITEELIADESGMRAIVDSRLRQFIGNREDLQILKGNGTAPNISGILDRAGLGNTNYSLAGASAQGLAEAAFQSANLVRTAFQTPTGYVMAVGTWEYIALAKDSQNAYLFPNALQNGVQPRLWGLPVTTNENMDAFGVATNVPILVGDWQGAATIFRRQGVQVQVSDSHASRFMDGVLTIRLTERLALVVWRPAGFATVTRTA